jgi:hypothetical protein
MTAYAARLAHHPLRVILPALILAWFAATAVLAAHRGAERRLQFDGAVHR